MTPQFQQIWTSCFQFNIDVWSIPPTLRYHIVDFFQSTIYFPMKWSVLYSRSCWLISDHSPIWGHQAVRSWKARENFLYQHLAPCHGLCGKSPTPKSNGLNIFESSCFPLKGLKMRPIGYQNQLNPVESCWIPHFQMPTCTKTPENTPSWQPRGPLWLQQGHLRRPRKERLDPSLQRRDVGVVLELPWAGLVVVLPRWRSSTGGWITSPRTLVN